MRKITNKKLVKIVFCTLALILTGVIGTTFAYYTAQGDINNMLITSDSAEVYIAEYFKPNDLWLPGETKEKKVHFGNQSEVDQVMRFKVITQWFDNKGTPDDFTDDTPWSWTGTYDPAPATINWTTEITGPGATWTKIGDYYYYNKVLAGGTSATPTETQPVINSVTFSPALSSGKTQADDFTNKLCRITIQMETLDVSSDITEEAWGVRFTGTGDSLTWN